MHYITIFLKNWIKFYPVKSGDDLKQSDGLIIPGGESTTLSLLMKNTI